jgi:hypothetical protein
MSARRRLTGDVPNVGTHVSGIVWPSSMREALAVPGDAPHGPPPAPDAAAPAAPSP